MKCKQQRHRAESLRPSTAKGSLLALCLALLTFGCAGSDDDDSESTETGNAETSSAGTAEGSDTDTTNTDATCDASLSMSETPLFKLSTLQYINTMRDLLAYYGLEAASVTIEAQLARIPTDSLGDSFRRLDDRIAIEHVQGFFDVGVAVGDALLEDSTLLHQVAGDCASDETLDDVCWANFKDGFLAHALRHPLSASEAELYDGLRDGTRTGQELIRAAVVVALSSPRFVYQVEVDGTADKDDDSLLTIDAYELASRLSYTFWQTMPDDELFAAAEDGSLLEDEGYSEQLKRVWSDSRAQDTIEQFWMEWLKLEKFTGFETSRPAFQSLTEGEHFGEVGHDHYGDMVQEVVDLTKLFVFGRPGTLSELLTTDLSVTQSSDLASLYGVAPWQGEGEYPSIANRAGLLQRGALLVSNLEQTNPFHRGALIRRQILCGTLAQPDPNDLPPGSLDPPLPDQAQSTRDRFQAKVEGNGLCERCHNSFSNIGYVLESFDAVGRYRTTERVFDEQTGELLAELPIDTVAEVTLVSNDEPAVPDAATMNQRFVESGLVEACLAENYFEFFSRRAMSNASLDPCVVDDLATALADDGEGLANAFQHLAQIPAFFTRKVGAQ